MSNEVLHDDECAEELRYSGCCKHSCPTGEHSTVDFQAVGRQAHADGDMAAPALNTQVLQALEGRPVGDPEVVRILKAFNRGYREAVNADVAALFAADFPDFAS